MASAEGVQVGRGYVQIIPSAKGIKGSISNILSGESSDAGSKAGALAGSNLVGAVKGIIATAGLSAVVGKALTEGAALQQSIGGIETLYKDSSAKMIEYANQAYKTAGLSANAYMEQSTSFAASLVSSLGGDTAKAAEAANQAIIDMADNSNKMGTSLSSIQNAYAGFAKQNYTMLDNLKLGYGGTKTEMERLLADAQKLTGVKYDIGNLADVYSAIHVIQDNLDITGTTAREAASTFSGSMLAMQAAATNFLGKLTLGEDVKEEVAALIETTSTFLLDNAIPMVGNMLAAIPPAIMQAAPMIGEAALGLIEDVSEQIFGYDITSDLSSFSDQIMDFLSLTIPEYAAMGLDFILSLALGAMEGSGQLLDDIGFIVESILIGLENGVPQILDKGIEFITSLANGALQNAPAAITAIGNIVASILGFLLSNMPMLLQKGVELIGNLASGVIRNLPAILAAFGSVIANILATIARNLPAILGKGIEILGNLAAGIIRGIPRAIATIPQLFSQFASGFRNFDWGSLGGQIIEGIKNGILGAAGRIAEAAREAASSAFNAAKSFLGIASPSKLFRDQIGKNMALGMAEGFDRYSPEVSVTRTISGTVTAATQAAKAARPVGGSGGRWTIQVPLYIDGREFARATGEAIFNEMGRITVRNARMEGVATA